MLRALPAILVLALLLPATGATGAPTAGSARGKVKCKKGYVRKRVRGKLRCVKRKVPAKKKATPGLDATANPGTYKGSNDAIVTTSKQGDSTWRISISVSVNKGYVFCPGRPPTAPLTVSVANMELYSGHFSGTQPTLHGQAQITGDFTAGNSLKIDLAATGVRSGNRTCGAQVHGLTIVL